MTGQSNDAAERSAHVQRGGTATASDAPHPVVEWRNAAGQTVACARGVAELRAENERLREALERIARADFDCTARQAWMAMQECARAALTPRADAVAPHGWDEGSNVR